MAVEGGIAVYVTSHGFGHLNRTVAVLNRLPAQVPVVIHCDSSLFDHWGERLQRPASLEHYVSDCGALNPPGNSQDTDGPAPLELATRVHAEALEHLDDDVRALREAQTQVVLCDAPALPLVAARRAGIPGYLLANFTWADIYAPHARRAKGEAPRLVKALRNAYRHATAIFRAEPALGLKGLAPLIDVGMVVTPGRNRRTELRRNLGLAPAEKLVYFYVGRYGQDNLGWERLERLRGLHFVGFHPAPVGTLRNLHVVPATEWTGADLAASVDVIVAKAGYGTVCEAMVAGTPIIYPPRRNFAEHRVLDRALRAWGGGLPASTRDFAALKLEPYLLRAWDLKPGPPPFSTQGAAHVAAYLKRACRGGGAPDLDLNPLPAPARDGAA
jgi:hypothetical protein